MLWFLFLCESLVNCKSKVEQPVRVWFADKNNSILRKHPWLDQLWLFKVDFPDLVPVRFFVPLWCFVTLLEITKDFWSFNNVKTSSSMFVKYWLVLPAWNKMLPAVCYLMIKETQCLVSWLIHHASWKMYIGMICGWLDHHT